MYRTFCFSFIILTGFAFVRPVQAQTMDCVVRDPNPPLNVREEPNGKIVSTLSNGTRLFPLVPQGDDSKWVVAGLVSGGQWKRLGEVVRSLLDCSETSPGRYPYVITNPPDLKKFGLALRGYGLKGDQVTPFSNKCFFYGDGGYDVSLSNEFRAFYAAKGLSFDNMCAALRHDGLRYDPETGKRLATYVVADIEALRNGPTEPGAVSGELPLEVPECFKVGTLTRALGSATFKKIGCQYRYHPWSGRPLETSDGAALAREGIELGGDSAPGTPAEAAKAALDAKLVLSSTQIEAEARKVSTRRQ